MSWQTINGINAGKTSQASGGMMGSQRPTSPATFAPYPQASQVMSQPQYGSYRPNPNGGSAYTKGAGMQGGPAPLPASQGIGTHGTYPMGQQSVSSGVSPYGAAIVQQKTGVNPGQAMPSAVGPQQNPQFDPNDPNNAALIGYQNGGNG